MFIFTHANNVVTYQWALKRTLKSQLYKTWTLWTSNILDTEMRDEIIIILSILKEWMYVYKIPRRALEQQGNVNRNSLHKWLTVLTTWKVWTEGERQGKKIWGAKR